MPPSDGNITPDPSPVAVNPPRAPPTPTPKNPATLHVIAQRTPPTVGAQPSNFPHEYSPDAEDIPNAHTLGGRAVGNVLERCLQQNIRPTRREAQILLRLVTQSVTSSSCDVMLSVFNKATKLGLRMDRPLARDIAARVLREHEVAKLGSVVAFVGSLGLHVTVPRALMDALGTRVVREMESMEVGEVLKVLEVYGG